MPEAANALTQLCELYWPPIYSFIRRRGYAPSDAQDLTQSFFAFFLRTKAFARTDRLHGKFRSFLLASVKNFLADNWDRNQAIRRGGDYQFVLTRSGDSRSALRRCKRFRFNAGVFIRIALGENRHRWRSEFVASGIAVEGKLKLFEQLKSFLAGGSVLPSYDDASARTGLSRATVKTQVHRLRQRYREIVRCEIARTVSAPHEIDEELHYLCNVLAQAA